MYYFIGERTKKKFDTFLYGGSISKSLLRFLQFHCYVKIKCTFSQENIKAANNSAETLATNFTWILPNLLLVVTFFFPHFPPGGGTYFEATLLVSKVVKSQFSLTHTKNWCTNFYNHHVCRLKWHILIFRLTLQFTVSYRHEFETGFPAPQTPLHYGTIRILKLCTICA